MPFPKYQQTLELLEMPTNDLSEMNREIGRLEARMDAVEAEVGDLKALVIKKFDSFEQMLTSINEYIITQKAAVRITGWFITKMAAA